MADELAEQRTATTSTQVDATTSIQTGPRRPAYVPSSTVTASGKHNGSNTTIQLLHTREAAFYEEARDRYLDQNSFTVASDLQALDRLLLFEVQVYRWQYQLASGVDYDLVDLEAVEERDIRRSLKDTAAMISQIQNDLGLTMSQRLKAQDVGTTGEYIKNLRLRAQEHGIHRDKQLGKGMELMNEIFAIAGAYKRSNENERLKLGYDSPEDVIDWILEVAQPQYDAVDLQYRTQNQKLWVRSL